ncbi:MAG: hypothetical protein LV481_11275 [Methylacidiphilales bacterium]|nr:hypothetical protein [Candidatus Methylacidiphilales bacterium]
MPWNRNDPDPLEIKRRKLEEQERLLSEQMSRLMEEMHNSGEPMPEEIKPPEPPVWRLEDDAAHPRAVEPAPARKRNLARQTQRDMNLFFVFGAVLLLVLVLVFLLWRAYAHHIE